MKLWGHTGQLCTASLTDPWNDLKIGSTIEFFPISKWSKKLYSCYMREFFLFSRYIEIIQQKF